MQAFHTLEPLRKTGLNLRSHVGKELGIHRAGLDEGDAHLSASDLLPERIAERASSGRVIADQGSRSTNQALSNRRPVALRSSYPSPRHGYLPGPTS